MAEQEQPVMTPQHKLRRQLDQIDMWLSEEGGGYLWDVLSALRGPDDESRHSLKDQHTIPIRRAALPRTAKASDHGPNINNSAYSRASFNTIYELSYLSDDGDRDHFAFHINAAVRVLDGAEFEGWEE